MNEDKLEVYGTMDVLYGEQNDMEPLTMNTMHFLFLFLLLPNLDLQVVFSNNNGFEKPTEKRSYLGEQSSPTV